MSIYGVATWRRTAASTKHARTTLIKCLRHSLQWCMRNGNWRKSFLYLPSCSFLLVVIMLNYNTRIYLGLIVFYFVQGITVYFTPPRWRIISQCLVQIASDLHWVFFPKFQKILNLRLTSFFFLRSKFLWKLLSSNTKYWQYLPFSVMGTSAAGDEGQ